MFGPKISTVFRSRWNALFWSLGILATAYCSVPDPGQNGDSAAQKAAEDAVGKLLGQAPSAPPAQHANPWSKGG